MKTTVLTAHAYGQPEVLELVEYNLPQLASGYARIQVKAAGINPIDARRMTGEFKHAQLPQTFGTEFAGIILEIAENSRFNIGDEVLGSGGAFTHATVIDVPIENLVKKPARLDWATAGSLAGASQTAMTILDEMGPAQSLLIHGGAGGVGSVLIQLAVKKGIHVVATASASNQEHLREIGADAVVYGDGLIERLKQIHPTSFDVSIDMAGTDEATQASLATVKSNGFKGTIAGRKVSSDQIKPVWVKRNRANLTKVVDHVASGQLSWVVSREYTFQEAQKAYADILEGHTKGKSVLVFE